jgi:molybdopterin-guanine dinucleotide biosynthesis protein A
MGADKASLRLDGVALVDRVVARLRSVADPILIARGDRAIEVPGCLAIGDAASDAGPLGGLLAALRASPHRLIAVVAVDMPWVDPALVRMLAIRCDGLDASVPVGEHGPEPLHAVYSQSAIGACADVIAGHDRSLRALLSRLRVGYLGAEEWRAARIQPAFARNLNTPEDLDAFNRAEPR